jgi:hypothetical protein
LNNFLHVACNPPKPLLQIFPCKNPSTIMIITSHMQKIIQIYPCLLMLSRKQESVTDRQTDEWRTDSPFTILLVQHTGYYLNKRFCKVHVYYLYYFWYYFSTISCRKAIGRYMCFSYVMFGIFLILIFCAKDIERNN